MLLAKQAMPIGIRTFETATREADMNAETTFKATPRERIVDPEVLRGSPIETTPPLEPGDWLEGGRAFDESVLAEVPYALDAYMSRQ